MKRLAPLITLLLIASQAPATTVYKSVDDKGVVRFSDRPPDDTSTLVGTLELPARQPAEIPDSRQLMEDMAATTERLREDRLRREARRAPSPGSTDPDERIEQYPSPSPLWYPPGPWRHGYRPDRSRDQQQHQPPDTRSERDRRRDDMEGTWYIPRRLPGLGSQDRER